jgi:hypothetical protein
MDLEQIEHDYDERIGIFIFDAKYPESLAKAKAKEEIILYYGEENFKKMYSAKTRKEFELRQKNKGIK